VPELIDVVPGSPEWLAARRQGVTATDIGTILGLSAWDSVYSLFWRKMGQVPDEPERDRWELGKALEPYIIKRWGATHDGQLIMAGGLFRHADRAWQMATPDGRTAYEEPIELKSWADADRKRWEDGPPAVVRAQVLWQMDVMDVAVGHVGVVFLPSGEFRSYTIGHDSVDHYGDFRPAPGCRSCHDLQLMREAGSEFMGRLRLELPSPDPDSSAATLAAVRARFTRQPGKQADVDGALYESWAGTKDVLAIIREKLRGFEIELREQAGEASVYTVDGEPVACRVISDAKVKAHTRHMDYLRRITPKGDDDANEL